jgi:hypothetical protein
MADREKFCLRSARVVPAIAAGKCRDDRGDFRVRDDALAYDDFLARDESLARGDSFSRSSSLDRGDLSGDADFRAGDDAPARGERFEWVVGGSPVQSV